MQDTLKGHPEEASVRAVLSVCEVCLGISNCTRQSSLFGRNISLTWRPAITKGEQRDADSAGTFSIHEKAPPCRPLTSGYPFLNHLHRQLQLLEKRPLYFQGVLPYTLDGQPPAVDYAHPCSSLQKSK